MPGIDPGTSRMLSERSTIWATSPWHQHTQFHSVSTNSTHTALRRKKNKEKVEMPGIDPGTSRMQSERSTIWATSLWHQHTQFHSVSTINTHTALRTKRTKKTWRRRASIPVPLACKANALPFELHPPDIITHNFIVFQRLTHTQHYEQKEQRKRGDAGHRSRYLSHAKRALYHLSYIPLTSTHSISECFND